MLKVLQSKNKTQRKWVLIFSPIVALAVFGGVSIVNNLSKAVKATDFNPGRIIDDEVFYNKDAMSVQQIQDFLNKQVGSCDTWGTGPSGQGDGRTAAQFAAAQNSTYWHKPPYVCINNYHENPSTGETSFEKGGGAFSGGISAAQIIYNASQKYGINPQVLLVLLKKESLNLLNDTWPVKGQYKYAMGYACPDSGANYTAACESSKGGFYNQMTLAAWQLKYYKDNKDSYHLKLGVNQIQYSPNPTCGTKTVNIENVATLSLYIYTPYTPNDAALQNYPGTANCGAYGNRNFFMFFNQLFGNTYARIFQPMWQPRQLKTTKEVSLYDAVTGEVIDTRPADLIVNFVDKAILKNGKECLRSDASQSTQKNNCILFEELEEIFQPMWQPRQLKTTKEVSLYDAVTGEVIDTRPADLIVNFVDKAILKNGKECLRSDASQSTQKNNCILFEELEEIKIDRQ